MNYDTNNTSVCRFSYCSHLTMSHKDNFQKSNNSVNLLSVKSNGSLLYAFYHSGTGVVWQIKQQ